MVYGRIGLCNQEFRDPRDLAGVGGQHPRRALRRRGRRALPAAGHRLALVHRPPPGADHHRPVAPGPRCARGDGPGAALVPGRGDRHAGRRAGQGTRHHRRQPGPLGAGRRTARCRPAAARRHDQHRQLPERDDPPRPRDPPRALAARAAARGRGDLDVLVAGGGRWSAPIFDAGDRPRSGRCCCGSAILMGTAAAGVDIGALDDLWFAARAAPRRRPGRRGPRGSSRPRPHADLTIRVGPWGDRYGDDPVASRSTG